MSIFTTNLGVRMTAGDTPTLAFSVFNPDGSQYSIGGATGVWTLKKNVTDEVALVTKNGSGNGLTFVAPNIVNVKMNAGDTEGLSGMYCHNLVLTDNSGNVLTVKTIDQNNVDSDCPAVNRFQIDP